MKKGYFLIVFFFIVSYAYAQDKGTGDTTTASQIPQNSTLNKNEEIKGFAIYPNPVSNGILRITTLQNAKKTVQVFDVLGKQVFSRTIISQHVNISVLNSGIYILKVFEKGKVVTRKLVVK